MRELADDELEEFERFTAARGLFMEGAYINPNHLDALAMAKNALTTAMHTASPDVGSPCSAKMFAAVLTRSAMG